MFAIRLGLGVENHVGSVPLFLYSVFEISRESIRFRFIKLIETTKSNQLGLISICRF